MMKCPNCSESVPDNNKFCTNCGSLINTANKIPKPNQHLSATQSQPPIDQFASEKEVLVPIEKEISKEAIPHPVQRIEKPQVDQSNVKKDQPLNSPQPKKKKKGHMKTVAVVIVLLLMVSGMSMVYLNTDNSDSPKDRDNDGYPDHDDAFPDEPTQWIDTDGDGYGDNLEGDNPDAFSEDKKEWNDTDSDGIGDNSDIFPHDSSASKDTDGDGYPDKWNQGKSQADSLMGLILDAFPFESSQWIDNDGDGYGDNPSGNNPDRFPDDKTEWEDTDQDDMGDNSDDFPLDPAASIDSDHDGYPDTWNIGMTGDNSTSGLKLDAFPDDPAASVDSDADGYPESWNTGKTQNDSTTGLFIDVFPNQTSQWSDFDGDGYGDNLNGTNPDVFPKDKSEWYDTDMDGVGDNTDDFISDPAASVDTDGDNRPDYWNPGMSELNSTLGLSIDSFPNDPAASIDSDSDNYPDEWNPGKSQDDSTTNLSLDDFPTDIAASLDTDGDNYPNCWNPGKSAVDSTTNLSIDAYPTDPAASIDTDDDGHPDKWNQGMTSDNSTMNLTIDNFPTDPSASQDSDSDGFPDMWNVGKDSKDSTLNLTIDAFPDDPAASKDTDNDTFPDGWNPGKSSEDSTTNLTLDVFIDDPTQWSDFDEDGYGDNINGTKPDRFPADKTEWNDTDEDQVGDNSDAFPDDVSASIDTDNDHFPDDWNPGMNETNTTTGLWIDKFPLDPAASLDSDDDGYPDDWNENKSQEDSTSLPKLQLDIFPFNPLEWNDTDSDDIGDNSDDFITDPAASIDTDNDGYPDLWNNNMSEANSTTGLQLDMFPDDPSASVDTDGDHHPDNWNVGMNETNSTTGLILDAFPNDPSASIDTDRDGYPDAWNNNKTQEDSTTNLTLDVFPLDKNEWWDTDSDGIGNNADTDDDNDGYNDTCEQSEGSNPLDNASKPLDTDLDFLPDSIDPDDDNDGISDVDEDNYNSDPLDPTDVRIVNGILIDTNFSITRGYQKTGYLLVNNNGEIEETITICTDFEKDGNGTFTIVTSRDNDTFIHEEFYENTSFLNDSIHESTFHNVEVTVNAVSYFIDGWTYGIGITSTEEFAFMYPGEILSLFNNLTLTGTIVPSSVFSDTTVFASQLFGEEGMLQSTLEYYNISFLGGNLTFLYVDNIQYETHSISGDVYGQAILGDLEIADAIHNSGMEYMNYLSVSLNNTMAIVLGEQNNSLTNFTLWGIVLPHNGTLDLDGIVSVEVIESEPQSFIDRLGLNISVPQNILPINIKFGVCPDLSSISTLKYENKSVSDLWEMTDNEHSIVANVQTTANAFCVDIDNVNEKLQEYFGEEGNFTVLNELTACSNLSIALLFDLNASVANRNNKTDLMHQIAIAIIPDFEGNGSGFYTFEFSGVLYQLGKFLGLETDIPLLVVESYREASASLTLNLNVASVCIGNYTIGYGSNEEEKFLLISDETIPALFCNMTVHGIILPVKLLWLLAPDFSTYSDIIDDMLISWEIDITIPNISVLYVKSYSYKDTIQVTGDPYTILSCDSTDNVSSTFSSDGLDYIIGLVENYTNAQVIVLGSDNSTIGNWTFWFIYSTENLTKAELEGLPTLNICEIDYSIFDDIIGYEFITSTLEDIGIFIRIGTAYENDPVIVDTYTESNITDTWNLILDADNTAVESIEVDSYAFVVSLQDALDCIDSFFDYDGLEKIQHITSYADPAIAFMIDKDMFDIFSGNGLNLSDVLSIAFIPNYNQTEYGNINYFHFEGVVYNLTKFFGLTGDQGIPLLVVDYYEPRAPNSDGENNVPVEAIPLNEIKDNANPSVTWFKTNGFISGTTGKTVAKYAKGIPIPSVRLLCEGIQAAPIDLGVYVLSNTTEDDKITYSVPVIMPTVTKGQTYFGDYVELTGFYVNLSGLLDKIKNLINITDIITKIKGLFGNIFKSLVGKISEWLSKESEMVLLEGFFIACTITKQKLTTSIDVESTIHEFFMSEHQLKITITGEVTDWGTNSNIILHTPNGTFLVEEQSSWDKKFEVKIEIEGIPENLTGDYNIEIYVRNKIGIMNVAKGSYSMNYSVSIPPYGDTGDSRDYSRALRNENKSILFDTWNETLENDDESDFYRVYIEKGEMITIDLLLDDGIDHNLYLHNITDEVGKDAIKEDGKDEQIIFSPKITGWYYIEVRDEISYHSGKYVLNINISKDTDGDCVSDDDDVDPFHDIGIKLEMNNFIINSTDSDPDVYFVSEWKIIDDFFAFYDQMDNGTNEDDPIELWIGNFSEQEGYVDPSINVPDNQKEIQLRITLKDKDSVWDDNIDISTEQDDRYDYELEITINLTTGEWYGDDDDGYTVGDSEGDYNGALYYTIEIVYM